LRMSSSSHSNRTKLVRLWSLEIWGQLETGAAWDGTFRARRRIVLGLQRLNRRRCVHILCRLRVRCDRRRRFMGGIPLLFTVPSGVIISLDLSAVSISET
jgi:hypothetical protein